MRSPVNFDKYWGVQRSSMKYDFKSMSMTFNLFWTVDSIPCRSRLRFNGISRYELSADKVFESSVVELIAIEGRRVDGSWQIAGELSNYEFAILCADIQEDSGE